LTNFVKILTADFNKKNDSGFTSVNKQINFFNFHNNFLHFLVF